MVGMCEGVRMCEGGKDVWGVRMCEGGGEV